jgi:hypothetical protein
VERHAVVEQALRLTHGVVRRALDALGLSLDAGCSVGERPPQSVPRTGVAGSAFLVSIAIVGHGSIVPRPGVDASAKGVTTRD